MGTNFNKNQTNRITQLEDKVRVLKAQLEQTERKNEKKKTSEVIARQEDLEKISRHQAVLIKVLQIMQSAESLSQAMNEMLAEIGKSIGVSRVYVFEKNNDGTSISCTFDWSNTGITRIIDDFQNTPIEIVRLWFEVFDAGEIINTSDINTLNPKITEILKCYDVKSFLDLPLTDNGVHYGFIGIDECACHREWDENEVELLKSISQILSATRIRYQAENIIKRSHDTMRTVMNKINAYIIVADFETMEILFVNDRFRKLAGVELEGKKCWKVLQVDKCGVCDFCPRKYLFDEDKYSNGVYHFELFFEKFKQHLAIDAMVIEWTDGRKALLEVLFDITELKLAEQELVMERDRLQAIGDNFPDGSLFRCEINPQNMEVSFSYLGKTWEEVMGISVEETMADPSKVFANVLPEYSLAHDEELKRCTSMLQQFFFEYEISYKGLKNKWVQVSSYPKKITDDKVIFDGFILDITDRKHGEIELVRAREKAEESDRLKSAFLANMSHEIRTPINGIIGFLHFLDSDDLSHERRTNYMNIIKNSSAQLVQLIDDIIDVSKIEAKQMNIFPVTVDVNQMMNELLMFFESYLKTKNKSHIMLILDDSEFIDQCITVVDPVRLRQVLINLINNAVKFTNKGYIRFGYRQSAPDKLEFMVEDTGIGMSADQHKVAFDRFWQAENHFHEGTGLGLNIAQSLVQMMGGDIWLESTKGIGSTFYFTIMDYIANQDTGISDNDF